MKLKHHGNAMKELKKRIVGVYPAPSLASGFLSSNQDFIGKINPKSRKPLHGAGFTFVETIVAVAIFLILIALIAPNFLNFRSRTSSSTTIDTFITDLKNQQVKAMTGDTEGRGTPDTYSIYLTPGNYVLFHGQNYSAQDPENFAVPIDEQYELLTTFADNKIVFAAGSGEIVGFTQGAASVTIREIRTGQQKVIQINKYGTITQIN